MLQQLLQSASHLAIRDVLSFLAEIRSLSRSWTVEIDLENWRFVGLRLSLKDDYSRASSVSAVSRSHQALLVATTEPDDEGRSLQPTAHLTNTDIVSFLTQINALPGIWTIEIELEDRNFVGFRLSLKDDCSRTGPAFTVSRLGRSIAVSVTDLDAEGLTNGWERSFGSVPAAVTCIFELIAVMCGLNQMESGLQSPEEPHVAIPMGKSQPPNSGKQVLVRIPFLGTVS